MLGFRQQQGKRKGWAYLMGTSRRRTPGTWRRVAAALARSVNGILTLNDAREQSGVTVSGLRRRIERPRFRSQFPPGSRHVRYRPALHALGLGPTRTSGEWSCSRLLFSFFFWHRCRFTDWGTCTPLCCLHSISSLQQCWNWLINLFT
jgi:hypothetical protein